MLCQQVLQRQLTRSAAAAAAAALPATGVNSAQPQQVKCKNSVWSTTESDPAMVAWNDLKRFKELCIPETKNLLYSYHIRSDICGVWSTLQKGDIVFRCSNLRINFGL